MDWRRELRHLVEDMDHLGSQLSNKSPSACRIFFTDILIDIMWRISQLQFSCILFMSIKMKFIYCHSCVMFVMKSMSMYND